jgi:NADP-reducing hydrogenase subunit HndD
LPNEDDDILETYMQKRANVLYEEDKSKQVRRSHLNKDIQFLYNDYLKEPGSELAHKLLHTKYNSKREKYPDLNK